MSREATDEDQVAELSRGHSVMLQDFAEVDEGQ